MRVIDLATLSLAGGSGIAEAKVVLWSEDGAYIGTTASTSGIQLLTDGSSGTNSSSASNTRLFTLSSTWDVNTQFSFETTLSQTNAGTCYATLYDFTSGTVVSSAQVSVTGSSLTVVHSSKFTLIPGHQYGVTWWSSTSSNSANISDASLIIFP